MDPNAIINGLYHSSIISALVIANSMLVKNLLRMRPTDLNKLDFKDGIIFTANVYAATMTKKALIDNGILPENIIS